MTFGLLQYVFGWRYLGTAGLRPPTASSPEMYARAKRQAMLWIAVGAAVIVLLAIAIASGAVAVTSARVTTVYTIILFTVTLAIFGSLFMRAEWTPIERRRFYMILMYFIAAALFWSVFEQAGSTLNLFADRNTRTELLGMAFPSSWFQSLNSLFLIFLAPVFAWIWVKLAARGQEPSSPAKFAFGLVFVGLGFAILVPPARMAEGGTLVTPMWLTMTYLLHTIGELALSPVGLSAMTTLSPARIAGMSMGVWFLASSVGNFIGGRVSGFYESMPLPSLFGTVAAFAIVAGLLLFALVPSMRKLMVKPPAAR